MNGALASDRPLFPAVAISPDGRDVYLTYDSFLQPWQSTTANPRLMRGVVRQADVSASAALGAFTDLRRAPAGDARGSSQNNLAAGFLGDYNYAFATHEEAYVPDEANGDPRYELVRVLQTALAEQLHAADLLLARLEDVAAAVRDDIARRTAGAASTVRRQSARFGGRRE